MSEVEQRVVQMKFDNAQFEAGVQETLQSLNKLNKSIEDNTASNKSLTGLGSVFETIKEKLTGTEDSVKSLTNAFSPLGIAGKAAIENITNKLTDFTLNAAKTLSGITSMQAGFDKFTQKSKAISDLMNATGASMDQVADALDNLNWFTDETSYNFTDMVSTMAKLSASGEKDLSKLLKTTEGIALWGAKAGANAQTVSRSMYQLTQAVGRGYITYQDWLQSAVNTNMATSEIKQQLMEAAGATAKAAGAYDDFNESLKKGWLTFDVFSKVMDQYTEGIDSANYANGEFINSQNGVAGATNAFSEAAFRNAQECKSWGDVVDAVADSVGTSWMNTFEYIFGDYEEAKALWTGLANLAFTVSGKFSEARNAIFAGWKEAGGRTAMLQSFVNLVNALYRAVWPVAQAFKKVFGTFDGSGLAKGTKAVESFTKTLLITKQTMSQIYKVCYIAFAVIKNGIKVVKPFVKYIALLFTAVTVLKTLRSLLLGGLGISSIFGSLKLIIALGLISYIVKSTTAVKGLKTALSGVCGVLQLAATSAKNLFKNISSTKIGGGLISGIKTVAAYLTNALSKIDFSKVLNFASSGLKKIASLVTSAFNKIDGSKLFSSMIKLGKSLLTLIGALVTRAISGINQVSSKLKASGIFTTIKNALGKIPMLLSTAFETLSKFFNSIAHGVQNKTGNVFQIIKQAASEAFKPVDLLTTAFNGLSTALSVLKGIGSEMLNTLSDGGVIHAQAAEIEGARDNINKTGDALQNTSTQLANASTNLASASNSINAFTGNVSKSTSAVSMLFSKVSAAVSYFKDKIESLTGIKLDWNKIIPVAVLGVYAITIYKFSNAASKVGKSLETLADGINKMLGLKGAIESFINSLAKVPTSIAGLMDAIKDSVKKQNNIKMFQAIAIGIGVLTAALIALGYVPWERLAKGGIVLGIIVSALILVMDKITKFQATVDPTNVVALSAALLIFVICVQGLAVTLGIVALVTNHVIDTSQSLSETLLRLAAPIVVLGSLMVLTVACAHILADCLPAFTVAGQGLLTMAAGIAAFSAAMLLADVTVLATLLVIDLLVARFVALVAIIKLAIEKVTVTPELITAIVSAFGLVAAGIIGAVVIFKLLSKVTINLAKNVLILAGALLALAVAVSILSSIGDDLGKGVDGLIAVMAAFSVFIFALGAIPQLKAGVTVMNDVSKGLLMFAASIILLAVAVGAMVKLTNDNSFEEIMNGVAGIFSLLLGLAVAVKIMDACNIGKVAGGLLALVVALYALLPLIALFSIDWTMFLPGLAEVAGILLAIGGSAKLLSSVAGGSVIANVIALVAAIYALVGALLIMQDLDTGTMAASAAVLVACLITMGLVSKAIGSVASSLDGAGFAKFAGIVAVMTVAIVALSAAMNLLNNVPWENLLSFSVTIVAFGVAMAIGCAGVAVAVNMLSGLQFLEVAAMMIAFAAAVAIVAAGMSLLADVPTENISAFVWVIVALAAGLAVVTVVIGLFSGALTVAAPGMLALAAVILALGVGLAILVNAITNLLPNLQSFLVCITMLSTQSENLGSFAGSLALIGLGLIVLGAGALVAGAGVAVLSPGLFSVASALSIIIPLLTTLNTSITTTVSTVSLLAQNAQQIAQLAVSFGTMGKNLIVLGAGALVGAKGMASFNSQLIKVQTSAVTATSSINKLKASISTIQPVMSQVTSNATTWGSHLSANFASGIASGNNTVGTATASLAKTVWEWIHASAGAEKGYLAAGNVQTWGEHHAGNFATGITKGTGQVTTAVSGVGVTVSKQSGFFAKIGNMLGGSLVSGIVNKIKGFFSKLSGVDIGETISGYVENIEDAIGIDPEDFSFDSLYEQFEELTNLDEYLPDLDELGISMDDLAASTGGAGDAASGAASSTSDLAEKQKVLAKYTKYANLVMNGYMQTMGNVMSTINQTSLIDHTKEAFNELAEAIYQGTLEDSDAIEDASQSAEDRAQAVMEAFNEAFESVRDSAKDTLDFFSSFDKSLSDVITPKQMLDNFESQSKGIEAFYSRLQILAGKGFSFDIIKSLMDEGTSAYPKVVGMLKATADEVEKLNAAWDSKEAIANQAAVTAMVSLMTAQQVTKLKAVDTARKESVNVANDALSKYKKAITAAQEANLDMEETLKMVQEQASDTGETLVEAGPQKDLIDSYNELQEAMTAAGLSNEELQDAMLNADGFQFQENQVLTIMNRITELQTVIAEFEDIGTGVYDTTKSLMESSISYFDEWTSEYDMTADKLMANVQSQVQGVGQMMSQINQIVTHEAGARIFEKYGDQLSAEIVNAMSTMGDDALSQLENSLDYLAAAPVTAASAAQTSWLQYGQIGGMGYQQALSELATNQQLLTSSQSIGTNVGQGLVNGMAQMTDQVTTAGTQMGQSSVDGVATGAGTHSPSTKTYAIGQYLDQGLMNGMRSMTSTVLQVARTLGDNIVTTFRQNLTVDKFASIGRNICRGLIEGMNSESWSVIETATSIATTAYESACAALGVYSPSRKMKWVGQMFDQGFANGISDNGDSVQSSVTSTMQEALQTAVDLLDSTGDMQPTIRPIVDLSDAQNGSRLLSSMFDSMPAFGVRASLGNIVTPTDRMNAAIQGMGAGSASFGDTVINITAAPGQDEKAIADKVIKRLNNEYARRKAAWT